jgi:hypothetical protein
MSKAIELAKEMNEVKAKIDCLDDERSVLQKRYDELRHKSLPDAMQDEDLRNFSVTGMGRVNLQSDVHASILAANRGAAYAWMEANGHGGLVAPYVQPGSLKAWARGLLREGVNLPEDLFKVQPFVRAVITSEA